MTARLKTEIRDMAKARRRKLASETPDAADRLADWLAPHLLCMTDGPIAGYIACNNEIDPAPVLERLHAAGRAIALPALVERNAALVFRRTFPGDSVEPGPAYGIPQPPVSAGSIRPAVLLVPLLAHDLAGHRLGYGGGYYDRTIAALATTGPLVTIGLAYAGQEVERLPAEDHDCPLDMIATEDGPAALRDRAGATA